MFNPRWVRNWIYKLVEHNTDQRHGELDENHLARRLKECTTSIRDKVLELAKACQVAFPMRDANGQLTTSVLVPDLLQDLDTLEVWPSDNTIVDELRLPFLSDRILLRFVAEHWTCVPDKQKTYRNQVTVRVDNCDAMIQSIVEPSDGEKPFLRVCVNRTQTDYDYHRRDTKTELVKLLKAERLLQEDAKADWTSPSDTKRIAEDALRARIEKAIKDDEEWISAEEVGEKLDCDSKTVKRDKAICEVIVNGTTYHEGISGRIWKQVKSNKKYLYLESTVAEVLE